MNAPAVRPSCGTTARIRANGGPSGTSPEASEPHSGASVGTRPADPERASGRFPVDKGGRIKIAGGRGLRTAARRGGRMRGEHGGCDAGCPDGRVGMGELRVVESWRHRAAGACRRGVLARPQARAAGLRAAGPRLPGAGDGDGAGKADCGGRGPNGGAPGPAGPMGRVNGVSPGDGSGPDPPSRPGGPALPPCRAGLRVVSAQGG